MTSSTDPSVPAANGEDRPQASLQLPPLNVPTEAKALTDDGGVYKLMLNSPESSTETDSNNTELLSRPHHGDIVTVHLTARYFSGDKDGQLYGCTRGADGQGKPITFKLDNGETLKALEICLPTMRRGDKCRLFARCDYAYGDDVDEHKGCCDGAGGCHGAAESQAKLINGGCAGGNASVAIDVELLDWRGDDISTEKDGSVLRSVLRHGKGFVSPTLGSQVTVRLQGWYSQPSASPSDSETSPSHCSATIKEFLPLKQLQFELGEILPPTDGFCPAIEVAIVKMFKGELAGIWVNSPSQGYGNDGCQELSVPANASLVYQLELLDFVKPKEVWQLTRRDKLAEAEAAKARGVACLTAGNLKLAYLHCKRVVDYLEWDADFRDDVELLEARNCLLLAGRLNLALVCLRTRRFQQAVSQCSTVLEHLDPNNEKALYRRGQARLETCDYDLAMQDFQACVAINPANTAAKQGVEKSLAGNREVARKEKQIFAGMFDRFAKQDAKGKHSGDFNGSDFVIDTWDNSLADGMLSIPQELEAFGEEMPQKKRGGGGGGGGGLAASAIVEADEEK